MHKLKQYVENCPLPHLFANEIEVPGHFGEKFLAKREAGCMALKKGRFPLTCVVTKTTLNKRAI